MSIYILLINVMSDNHFSSTHVTESFHNWRKMACKYAQKYASI